MSTENILIFCRYKRTIRFIQVFVIREREAFNCILSTTFFGGGLSVQDGGVDSLWFLLPEQYQSFVLKI